MVAEITKKTQERERIGKLLSKESQAPKSVWPLAADPKN